MPSTIDNTLILLRLRQAMPTRRDAQELIEAAGGKLTFEQAWSQLESEAVGARQELAAIYREARAAGRIVAPELKAFMARLSDAIVIAQDPAAEAARLLNEEPKRGAPAKHEERDFIAAVEVEERRRNGMPHKVAIAQVSELLGLTESMVQNAHTMRDKYEVEVELDHRRR